jgi:plastocyanin
LLFSFSEEGKEEAMKDILFRIGLVALLVTLITVLAPAGRVGGVGAQEKTPASVAVKIDNFSFGPAALTVPAGTTVTWTNQDDIPHTVVSTDGVFKSKALDTDDKFSFVFSKPGTYSYFCSIHPKMTGQIIVQ